MSNEWRNALEQVLGMIVGGLLALVVACVVLWGLYKVPPLGWFMRSIMRILAEPFRESVREVVRHEQAPMLNMLRPNGGGSIPDKLDHVEARLNEVRKDISQTLHDDTHLERALGSVLAFQAKHDATLEDHTKRLEQIEAHIKDREQDNAS